jgi:hypothetical protein
VVPISLLTVVMLLPIGIIVYDLLQALTEPRRSPRRDAVWQSNGDNIRYTGADIPEGGHRPMQTSAVAVASRRAPEGSNRLSSR